MANLAARQASAIAMWVLLPALPQDKPCIKLNKAAPQGDYSLKATPGHNKHDRDQMAAVAAAALMP